MNNKINITASRTICAAAIALSMGLAAPIASAQQLANERVENPIYFADSPIASDALIRLPQLIAQDNLSEAARLTDEIITTLGDRLIESTDPTISITVRQRLHRFVLDHPTLLAEYRKTITPGARALLEQGQWARIARDAWLTEPGCTAALHRAQTLIEGAHFRAGLRALQELESHPDATAHAARAATLSLLAARSTNTQAAWNLAESWSTRAGQSIQSRPPALTPGSRIHTSIDALAWNTDHTGDHNQPTLNAPSLDGPSLDGIVPGSLGRAHLTPYAELDFYQPPAINTAGSGANRIPTPWVSPVVLDDKLYTNDGITISCFDRFTLRTIWRLQTQQDNENLPITPDARVRTGRTIEDTTTITAVGDHLYVPAGLPRNGLRSDNRLLKIDAHTGKVLWGVDVTNLNIPTGDATKQNQSAPSDTLNLASIRGQVIVDQGIVVFGARTQNRNQRLVNLAVVGLDAATGSVLWIHHIASAGSLPFQQSGQIAQSPILSDGTIYWTDQIGLAFAIEAATGTVQWARPLPAPDVYARFSRPSYSTSTPIVNEHGLFTLTTDGTQIIQLDKDTGQTIATRNADPVGESLYLIEVADLIACVSQNRITYYSAERFATATTYQSTTLGGPLGIRGRIVSTGNQLIVPISFGVEIVNPKARQADRRIELDSAGNILALDGQIIVVDETNISSYLSWTTASAILNERLERDPGSAITLAQLAHRANKPKETIAAIERAMSVINPLPVDQRQRLSDQLFDAVLAMIRSQPADSTPARSSADHQASLLAHLSTLAKSHQQVVAHRIALGAWRELHASASKAIAAYQEVLDQPTLSATMWEDSTISVRAGLEATRRIAEILRKSGYGPYRSFDQLAQRERTFLEPLPATTTSTDLSGLDPNQYEQLAKRFPWSSIAPSLWLDATKIYHATQQRSSLSSATSEGLDAARALQQLRVPFDQSVVDALAEHALTTMIAGGSSRSAASAGQARALADELLDTFPNLTLRLAGQIVTPDQIAQSANASNQLPILGSSFIADDQPRLLTGSPLKPTVRNDRGGVVLYAPQLGRIEYVRVGGKVFETFWSKKTQSNEAPMIPWQDEERVLMLQPQGASTAGSGLLESLETSTGQALWSIDELGRKLSEHSTRVPDFAAQRDTHFITPAQGLAPNSQIVIVTDGHTVIVSDRIGRAMGIDFETGEQLWLKDLPANRIHDMDLNAGVLAICGVSYTDQAQQQQEGQAMSIAAAINPRTGDTIQTIDRFGQSPRWIRVSQSGNLYTATTQRVVAINTKAGSIDWMVSDENLAESQAAWLVGDQLLVLDSFTDLWPINLADGVVAGSPIDTRRRIAPNGWIQAHTTIDQFIIASSLGLTTYNQQLELLAVDPISTARPMIDVAWGQSRAIFAQLPLEDGDQAVTKLTLLDPSSARLLDTTELTIPLILDRQPTSLTAITGGVLLGFNEVTVFVRTEINTQ